MKIIFLGAPGAGKGTQAAMLSERLGIPTISTGAIIRAAVKSGTEMGLKAKEFIDNGALVPDDVVIGIIKQRLAESDCVRGFILDGFPRTVPQAQAIEEMGIELDAVVSIEISDEEIVKRMSGRRVCATCGATYHVEHNPSADGVHCDKCHEELSIRSDDKPEVVKHRLGVYHAETEPLIGYYKNKNLLVTVDGQQTPAEVTASVKKVLGI